MKLKDIAAMANVSPSTVSLVVKNRSGVSAEKRKLILDLLSEYGYELPSVSEKKEELASEKKTILFIKYKKHSMLVDGNPGFVNAIIDSVEKECRQQGYNLQMATCTKEQLPTILELIKTDMPYGVLLLGTELDLQDAKYISNISIPMVVLDTNLPMVDCNCVTMNNEETILRSVNYLVSLGHKQIGFIANALPSNNCIAREVAFRSAIVQHGLEWDPKWVYPVHPTPEGAYQSISSLLEQGISFPSALVANNDSIALGALKAFKEHDIHVPNDISIVGFDGISFSSLSDPPLTTSEVPCDEMGIWAVRLLCEHLQYNFSSSTKMQISTHLVVRGSTAPYCES